MKLTHPNNDGVAVLWANPNGAYLVRFQDQTLGRRYVMDAQTDATGSAKFEAPPNFGRQGYAVSVQEVESGNVSYLVNRSLPNSLIYSDEPVSAPASTLIRTPETPVA